MAENAEPNSVRTVSLAIQPSRLDAAAKRCRLTLKGEELTEGNATSFYGKAVKALKGLPDDFDMPSVSDWRETPLRGLPKTRVRAVLNQAKTCLDLIRQGARCRDCTWRQTSERTILHDLAAYRHLACLLCVRARLEIAKGQYEKALGTIRTGLAAAKHVGEAPIFVRGLVSFMMATLSLQPVEDLTQSEDAPNLYAALHTLPHPLVDMEGEPVGARAASMPEDWCEVKLMIMKRLDAYAGALECIEALRHFAARHRGRLPAQLDAIKDLRIPKDPVTNRPFAYRVAGSKATLEVSAPQVGDPRHRIYYEIAVAR